MATPTLEQLPDLSAPYVLPDAAKEGFARDGHVLLRSVVSPEEASAYRSVIAAATEEYAKTYAPMDQRDTYGKAFIQLTNLWRRDERAARFTMSRRFGRIAAELMGVAGARVYHDQALYKEPGGGFTPWHQDQQYWPLDGVKCVTMWMALVDLTPDMGTLYFASGSQSLGYLGPQNISDDSEARWRDFIAERGYEVSKVGSMRAGDATFHDGWVLHGAPGNESLTKTREAMTIIFFEDGATISPPDSESRTNDLASWFPGLKPGDLAASELNPLVFSSR